MSDKIDDGGPAIHRSLLDDFAAIAFERFVQAYIDRSVDDLDPQTIVLESFKLAEAMLAEKRRREQVKSE